MDMEVDKLADMVVKIPNEDLTDVTVAIVDTCGDYVRGRGERYPNWFNSIFEFRQKMIQFNIQFNIISQKFNSKDYLIQKNFRKFNSKYYSIKKNSKKFNSKNYSIQ